MGGGSAPRSDTRDVAHAGFVLFCVLLHDSLRPPQLLIARVTLRTLLFTPLYPSDNRRSLRWIRPGDRSTIRNHPSIRPAASRHFLSLCVSLILFDYRICRGPSSSKHLPHHPPTASEGFRFERERHDETAHELTAFVRLSGSDQCGRAG